MAFKFVAALAFIVAVANAGVIVAPTASAVVQTIIPVAPPQQAFIKTVAPILDEAVDDDYDSHPQYKFSYSVQDSITGDSKSHVEERDGDVVHGEYSLNDADGFKRIVKYTSDSINGFNAIVSRVPLEHVIKTVVNAVPATVVKTSVPAAYAAPAVAVAASIVKTVAPIAYAPVAPTLVKTLTPPAVTKTAPIVIIK